jgi:hypothetical protein
MESARGECRDKIFSSPFPSSFALSDSKHLFGFGNAEERSTRKHKRRHILCCFMKDDDERRRKGKKCFYSFALFYDKYHCFVRKENVSSHTQKHPLHAIAT